MKAYLEYTNEIEGYQDVLETVKTVEKIAASNIHLLRTVVAAREQYRIALEGIFGRLLAYAPGISHPLLRARPDLPKALVLLTGDKGLVGGLYHGLVNATLGVRGSYAQIYSIGAKGKNYLAEEGIALAGDLGAFSEIPTEAEIAKVSGSLMTMFRDGSVGQVDIVYPKFENLSEHVPRITTFLPFSFPVQAQGPVLGLPIFDAAKGEIFDWMLQRYIGAFFSHLVLESKLSELSARTLETEQAAEKTKDLIGKKRLEYFKTRKRSLTQKQLESFSVHQML